MFKNFVIGFNVSIWSMMFLVPDESCFSQYFIGLVQDCSNSIANAL